MNTPSVSRHGRPAETATVRRATFARPTEPRALATFTLSVVAGPDAGTTLTVDPNGPSRALIGQSPVCQLRLADPQASRRHAALSVMDGHLELRDLGSTNGTTVNGVLVKEAILVGGEAIRVGESVISVARDVPRHVEVGQANAFGRVLGESRPMRKLFAILATLASNDHPVLLEGEAGTGKALAAEEIHAASRRKEGPFVVLETTSLASSDIERCLFGDESQGGLFAAAHSGVLYIDEVANLPRHVQARLLEALGTSDVRVIASTRRDLDRDVQNERFDEQLYFTLASGRVELPTLRDRGHDVALLARAFWSDLASTHGGSASLPEDFLPRFEHYPWPGNVRELRGAVAARMTLGELGTTYRTEEAKATGLDFLASVIEQDLPFPAAREQVVTEFEKRYVERVLARHGGNVTRAARASGVAHRYFQLIRARLR